VGRPEAGDPARPGEGQDRRGPSQTAPLVDSKGERAPAVRRRKHRSRVTEGNEARSAASQTAGAREGFGDVRVVAVVLREGFEEGVIAVVMREGFGVGFVLVAAPEQINGENTAQNNYSISLPITNRVSRISSMSTESDAPPAVRSRTPSDVLVPTS